MAITGNTELVATKQAAIAELVQRELAFQSKLLPTVADVSVYARPGDKSVSFPKAGSFTVENRVSGAEGTSQALTYAVDTLAFDYRAHVQWLIDNMDEYQAKPDIKADYIKRASTAHARNIDAQIISKLDAAAGYVQTAAITQAKILNAIQYLDQNFATEEGRFLVIPPVGRNQMLSIADFVRADALGTSNIQKGVIGEVYGVKVIVHSGAVAKSWLYTNEAIAWAFQKGAQYQEQQAITYGTGSYIAVLDQLYGSKSMRLGEGLAFDNTTPLGGTVSPFIAEFSG